jgi:hypothetical protein
VPRIFGATAKELALGRPRGAGTGDLKQPFPGRSQPGVHDLVVLAFGRRRHGWVNALRAHAVDLKLQAHEIAAEEIAWVDWCRAQVRHLAGAADPFAFGGQPRDRKQLREHGEEDERTDNRAQFHGRTSCVRRRSRV